MPLDHRLCDSLVLCGDIPALAWWDPVLRVQRRKKAIWLWQPNRRALHKPLWGQLYSLPGRRHFIPHSNSADENTLRLTENSKLYPQCLGS